MFKTPLPNAEATFPFTRQQVMEARQRVARKRAERRAAMPVREVLFLDQVGATDVMRRALIIQQKGDRR